MEDKDTELKKDQSKTESGSHDDNDSNKRGKKSVGEDDFKKRVENKKPPSSLFETTRSREVESESPSVERGFPQDTAEELDSTDDHEESVQKAIHTQGIDERRQSMNIVASDIKDCFRKSSFHKLPGPLERIKFKNSVAKVSESDSQRSKCRRESWLGTVTKKSDESKTKGEGMPNLNKFIRRPSWYDSDDIPRLADKNHGAPSLETIEEEREPSENGNLYRRLSKELKAKPETVIRLDTSEMTVEKSESKPRMEARKSVAWLGTEGKDMADTMKAHTSGIQTKYIHRLSWYDDDSLDISGIGAKFMPELPKVDEEEESNGSEEEEEEEMHEAEEKRKAAEKSKPILPTEAKYKEIAATEWKLPEGFQRRFLYYATAPDGEDQPTSSQRLKLSEKPTISLPGVDRWLENANILDHNKLTVVHTGFCFNAADATNKKRLTVEEFIKFLTMISSLKNTTLTETVNKLNTSTGMEDDSATTSLLETGRRFSRRVSKFVLTKLSKEGDTTHQ